MDLCTEDNYLLEFLDRLVDYWLGTIDTFLDSGVDVIMFADDWGTQSSTIISPQLFQKFFKPRYEKLIEPVKKAGRKVFFHYCRFLGEIFNELLDLDIDGLWPQINQAEADPMFVRKCVESKVAIYIHPDRQKLIPLGTPKEIEKTIGKYAERYHELGGGGIFYIEIENDAPFENVKALIELVHKYR